MRIRREDTGEFPRIYELIAESFKTADVADGDEQDWAKYLRESGNYIPELSLVAEEDGVLTGQVMMTRTTLTGDDGAQHDVLLLSPLSVKPGYRCRGIAGALITVACEKARQMGYPAVFLAGDPRYYGRFGFRSAADYGIRNVKNIPDRFALVLELQREALQYLKGSVDIT